MENTRLDLGRDLFAMFARTYSKPSQAELAEVLEEIPETRLTPEEIDHLANRFSRLSTDDILEGKVRKPGRPAND